MILKVDAFGIEKIYNTNTNSRRDAICIFKGMDISGALFISGNKISLGYNETIACETNEDAMNLFEIIHGVIICGDKVEDVINSVCDVAQNIFFQKA